MKKRKLSTVTSSPSLSTNENNIKRKIASSNNETYFNNNNNELNRKIIYENEETNNKIITIKQFATSYFCTELIKLAEKIGFETTKDTTYKQKTIDLEIDQHQSLKNYILSRTNFISYLTTNAFNVYDKNMNPYAFDDMFIVKYDANMQRDLVKHYDGGEISFMLALSERHKSYEGGGTKFDVLCNNNNSSSSKKNSIEHLDIGDIMLFNANMYHSGMPITKGLRYLLVGFCFIKPEAIRIEGNLNLNLEKILITNQNRFELYHHKKSNIQCNNNNNNNDMKDNVFTKLKRKTFNIFSSSKDKAGKSYWIPCGRHNVDKTVKKNIFYQYVESVFHFHVNKLKLKIQEDSGCEVWIQYLSNNNNNNDEGICSEEIPWHYDKDEELFKKKHILKHPTVATVTYLSNDGIPTVVFGEKNVLINYPKVGNHLAFSGSLVHGCPKELFRRVNLSQKKNNNSTILVRDVVMDDDDYRFTLLINIWMNGKPTKVKYMKEKKLSCDSKDEESDDYYYTIPSNFMMKNLTCCSWKEVIIKNNNTTSSASKIRLKSPDEIISTIKSSSSTLKMMMDDTAKYTKEQLSSCFFIV